MNWEKIKLGIIISLVVVIALIAIGLYKTKPDTSSVKKETVYQPTSYQTPAPAQSAVTNPRYIAAREELIAKSRPELEKGETKISLTGEYKQILNLDAKRLSNFEILQMFREKMEGFAEMGFTEMNLKDKYGNTQKVDLTILK